MVLKAMPTGRANARPDDKLRAVSKDEAPNWKMKKGGSSMLPPSVGLIWD
jgi:hypothetical protein